MTTIMKTRNREDEFNVKIEGTVPCNIPGANQAANLRQWASDG